MDRTTSTEHKSAIRRYQLSHRLSRQAKFRGRFERSLRAERFQACRENHSLTTSGYTWSGMYAVMLVADRKFLQKAIPSSDSARKNLPHAYHTFSAYRKVMFVGNTSILRSRLLRHPAISYRRREGTSGAGRSGETQEL